MSFILVEMSAERNVEKLAPVFVQCSWRSLTRATRDSENKETL